MENKIKHKLINNLQLEVHIKHNQYNINPMSLYQLAARKNKKRAFLFVSKVLGKHTPVQPSLSLLTGRLLGLLYAKKQGIQAYENELIHIFQQDLISDKLYKKYNDQRINLQEPVLIIGFAETATALGYSVFDTFSDNAYYIHTTREPIKDGCYFAFEEEHSHATSHKVYPKDFKIIESGCPIIFVDDEITTGKTVLNFIEEIHKKYPRKSYSILSILDWRSEAHKKKYLELEKKLNINIQTVSLLQGEIKFDNEQKINFKECNQNIVNENYKNKYQITYLNVRKFFNKTVFNDTNSYISNSGRFGTSSNINFTLEKQIQNVSEYLKTYRKGKRTLCLGTTEFMYIPMKISALLGDSVLYHSTTRSPIYPYNHKDYGVKNAIAFDSPNEQDIINYIYNIPQDFYDDVFIFFEKDYDNKKLIDLLNKINEKGISKFYIITCT